MSNLKQIGLGAMQYQQDYDGRVTPYETSVDGTANVTLSWYGYRSCVGTGPAAVCTYDVGRGLLQPYMKSHQIQDCPSAPAIPSGQENLQAFAPAAYAYNLGYLMPEGVTIGTSVSESQVEAPAETIFLADSAIYNATYGVFRTGFIHGPAGAAPRVHGRHSNRSNVLFLDGHVKALPVAFTDTTNSIGNLVHPSYPVGATRAANGATACFKTTGGVPNSTTYAADCNADYYFMLTKPKS